MSAYGEAAGAAIIAAQIEAIKSYGPLIIITPEEFHKILKSLCEPLLIRSRLYFGKERLMLPFKGVYLVTKARLGEIVLPHDAYVIECKRMFVPRL